MNAYLVEFLGTMFFLYVVMSTANAVAIGAALALTIIVGGAASGGMFNPVVTLVMATAGKLEVVEKAVKVSLKEKVMAKAIEKNEEANDLPF